MKKLILLTVFSLYCIAIQAQSWVYHPFPTDSAIWTNERGTYNVISCCPPVVDYYPEAPDRYCMNTEDTVISATTYSKVFYCGGAYKGGLRDDISARKVYFVPADSLSELLIYDFSVENGDTAYMYYEGPGGGFSLTDYYYIYTDSVLINGSYRKSVGYGAGPGKWVEGIGGTQGLFREAWPNVSNYYTNLACMSHRDTTLYPSFSMGGCSLVSGIDDKDAAVNALIIFPNPSTGIFELKWPDHKVEMIEVVDLLGNNIFKYAGSLTQIDLQNYSKGIYFIRLTDQTGNTIAEKVIKQ